MMMASASYAGNLSPDQVRSARGWLAWSQKELAENARVATSTVADFERGQRTPIGANVAALRTALETGGVRFLPDGGVTGPLPPMVARSPRPGMPVRWIEAQDLVEWAGRNDGVFSLPQLVGHLIDASLGHEVERLRFPSAESVRQPGWDGTTRSRAARHRYVPEGKAYWELTAQKNNLDSKATEDYGKRTGTTEDAATSTFVFVTLRHWPKKEAWTRTRKKAGPWRDVQVHDADDLVHWIEQAPAVGLWLAERLGKRPPGARELDACWDEWSNATRWPLTAKLVLCDRDEDAVMVQRWLRGEPAALSLQATSTDEVVAFFHATLEQLPEQLRDVYRARTLVATTVAARELANAPAPLYVVMTEPDDGVAARLVKQGHYVLLAYGERPESHGDMRVLGRPGRPGIEAALIEAGIAEASAARHARDCARNLTVLRRLIPAHAGSEPRWAKAPPRALLAALLAGGWDDTVTADRDCVVELAGAASYGEVEQALTEFVGSVEQRAFGSSDRPIKKVGSIWRMASPYDAWHLLAPHLTRGDLDRFQDVALAVLCAEDPRFGLDPTERWRAPVLGIGPMHSSVLRHGVGQVLITLALWGSKVHTVPDADRRAEAVVTAVLGDADAKRWWSLARIFRLLAEAAPDAFLSAIERSLDQAEQPIRVLLAGDGDHFGAAEYASNLLWALETLAWSPNWLTRVTHILARLHVVDTSPGRYGNRPMATLETIYMLWNPQTYAPSDSRLRILDSVRRQHNAVAWTLLLKLLPSGHGFSTNSPVPRWRDFTIDKPEVLTRARLARSVAQVSAWLVDEADMNAERWSELVPRLADLAPDNGAALARLETAESSMAEPGERAVLVDALRKELHRHREFPEAEWSMESEVLDRLHDIYRKLEPADPMERVAWLFRRSVQLPDPPAAGWEAEERALDDQRRRAAHDVYTAGGMAAVLLLASRAEVSGYLGKALYDSGLTDADLDALLAASLRSDDARVRDLGLGLIVAAFRDRKASWAEDLLAKAHDASWGPAAISTILYALPARRWVWDHAAQAGQEIEREYWRRFRTYWTSDDSSEVVFAIEKLISVGRARSAVAVGHGGAKVGLPSELLVEVLEAACESPSEGTEDGNGATMFQYFVEEILKVLDKRGDVDLDKIARLEWQYLPLLEHSRRPPQVLPRALAREPSIFITLLRAMFKPSVDSSIAEPPPDDPEQARLRATQAYRLLELWSVLPGTADDGAIDSAGLEAWIKGARRLALEVGRIEVADSRIGHVLASSPMGKDGHWPAEAVRHALDLFRSDEMASGFAVGKRNRRGATLRGLRDGGELERHEAATYRRWAKATSIDHPYTARVLLTIADDYEREARRHDQQAEEVDYEY